MPTPNPTLRSRLLNFYLEVATSNELSDWLRGIGQESKGTVAEKQQRVRENTAYLGMPATDFPEQTRSYLSPYSADLLADLCEVLGLSNDGPKDALYRRIMREVRYAEGWVSRRSKDQPISWTVATVAPFIEFYPITKRGSYERDFYGAFANEMDEVFGEENIHEQLAIAYGNPLRIDFHLGHPQGQGVGVEFKLPQNNGDIQRALGQLDQYRERYADRLILVLFPDFVDKAQVRLLTDQAVGKGIELMLK